MVRQAEPDKLRVTGRWWAPLAPGLLFLGIGVFFLISPWLAEGKKAERYPKYFVMSFGLVALVEGLRLLVVRKGVVLDRRERTVTTWWGLIVPLSAKTTSLADGASVYISREVRGSGKHRRVVYPVCAESADGNVEIEAPTDFLAARRRAEQVAEFLGIGIEDATVEGGSVRNAGDVGKSLHQRLRGSEEEVRLPPVPDGCRIADLSSRTKAVLKLPPEGFGVAGAAMLVVGGTLIVAATIAVVLWVFPWHRSRPGDRAIILAYLCTIGPSFLILGLLAVLSAIRKGRGRYRVVVGARNLILDWIALAERKSSVMPVRGIEEVGIWRAGDAGLGGRHDVMVVRGTNSILEFGRGLTSEERTWLRDAITAVIAARASSDIPGTRRHD